MTTSIRWLPVVPRELENDGRFALSQCGAMMTVRGGRSHVDCPKRGVIDGADCVACSDCIGVWDPRDGSPAFVACAGRAEEGGEARGRVPSRANGAPVRNIMTSPVVVVRVDDPIEDVVATLLDHGISGAPVIDGSGHPVGVVSKTDLVRLTRLGGGRSEANEDIGPGLSWASWRGLTAADVMVPLVLSVTEDATIAQAAAMMAFEGVHRLPVVKDGAIIGIVSSLDVLRWLAQEGGYAIARTRRT